MRWGRGGGDGGLSAVEGPRLQTASGGIARRWKTFAIGGSNSKLAGVFEPGITQRPIMVAGKDV
jgi:hypothetical protein